MQSVQQVSQRLESAPWGYSQRDCLLQHALTDAWLKSTLGHYVDWPAKQLRELELQRPEVKQGMAGIHVDERGQRRYQRRHLRALPIQRPGGSSRREKPPS